MKILHIYPANDLQLAQYVSLLIQQMPEDVETVSADHPKEAQRLCREIQPDIVHLHGHVECLLPRSQRLVITPHGQTFTQNAYALIARSSIEKKALAEHYERIEIIRNPLITRTTSSQELAKLTLAVYRKVMDSNVLELMDDNTRQTMRQVLKAAICGDRQWITTTIPSTADWRKLFIYAEHEGISSLLQKGIEIIGMDVPHINANQISCYLPNGYQRPTPMPDANIHEIIDMIHNESNQNKLSLLRLTEMHRALMKPDVDEELLVKSLQQKRLISFFACTLQLLSEQTGLNEGFMPCDPINDNQTEKLRIILKEHQQI